MADGAGGRGGGGVRHSGRTLNPASCVRQHPGRADGECTSSCSGCDSSVTGQYKH